MPSWPVSTVAVVCPFVYAVTYTTSSFAVSGSITSGMMSGDASVGKFGATENVAVCEPPPAPIVTVPVVASDLLL